MRCPKCGAAAPVPAPKLIPTAEGPVIEATVASPKPKPKPVVAEADDDDRPRKKSRREEEDADDEPPPRKKKKKRYDDDDDDPSPRRKRRQAAGGGGSGGIIALVVIGGLLLVGGIGFGIYYLTGKGSPLAKKTPVPAGWEQYSYPQDGIKAYFPKPPAQSTIPVNGLGGFGGGRFGGGRFGGGGFGPGDELRDAEAVSSYTSGDWNDGVLINVEVIRYRSKVPSSMRDEIRKFPTTQFGGMEMRSVRWLGNDAIEQTHPGGIIRIGYTDKLVVMVSISGKNGTRATPEEEVGFFDNFEVSK